MGSVDLHDETDESTTMAAGVRVERGKVVPHLTAEERKARGKAARREVPRESHATFTPGSLRPDLVELLERQAVTRVPELVPIRYGRMLVSPFAFYRGAALIMASDLVVTPRSGLKAQVCGDAHLMNFGMFASPERQLVFGINDFDETLPGPWEWDVKRLAASFVIAGRENNYTAKERKKVLLTLLGQYRTAMRQFAGMTNLAVWYAHLDVDIALQELRSQVDKAARTRAEANIAKTRTRDSMKAFDKLTHLVDGEPRIISDPPLVQPVEELFEGIDREQLTESLRATLRRYRRTLQSDRRHLLEEFRLAHVARKVVGVGSVGTRAFIVLLQGRDAADPLFLQIKEATASVLEPYVGKSRYRQHGERVVQGQRMMQAASDIYLGWTKGVDVNRHFYWRQLRDMKGSADVEAMIPAGLMYYARICGWTLARAHARSGDPIAIAEYLGETDAFDTSITSFSQRYADQNERDYTAFVNAVKSGRLEAVQGV
jgi:uncharacterized protein (DUF2252 family)